MTMDPGLAKSPAILRLERRLRALKFRLRTRAWELRQQHLAKGAWPRLWRVLAEAEEAYLITAEEAAVLEREGYRAETVGAEFEPPKWLGFVGPERARAGVGWRKLALVRSPALVTVRYLALVRFPEAT
jgi:hypothetical protein